MLRTPRSMVRRMVQCSHPTLRGKRNLSNPKPPLMIPSISTNTKQAQFLFFIFYLIYLFIIIIIIIFYAEQPKQVECHTSIVQPKEPQTSNPNWSLQPKNSRSKPTGGTKGVKNKNENKKENKNEKK